MPGLELCKNPTSINILKNIKNNFRILVSMAPLNAEACSLPLSGVPHLGTPIIEVI